MARKFNVASEIRGALRLLFRRSPQHAAAMRLFRMEFPRYKLDGTLSKKPEVSYQCARCKDFFKPNEVEVDHLIPIGPAPGSKNAKPGLTWDEFIQRMFCDVNNLQVLCKICHRGKTYKIGA